MIAPSPRRPEQEAIACVGGSWGDAHRLGSASGVTSRVPVRSLPELGNWGCPVNAGFPTELALEPFGGRAGCRG